MNLPYSTTSLCSTCYRHIPATVYEKDGKIFIDKMCSEHGTSTHMVENDASFFKSLKKNYSIEYWWDLVLIEVTDKCNLNCPHCYHLPDNRTTDRPIDDIVEQVKKIDCRIIMFAGAEPTVRKDFVELVRAVRNCGKAVHILTNGVRFAEEEFVKQIVKAGVESVCIGLNHPHYQGPAVHKKQLRGIINCINNKLPIAYIGYTLEKEYQLEYILEQAQKLTPYTRQIRIRFGSDIGRVPDEPLRTLSDNYKSLVRFATGRGYNVEDIEGDDNIYHKMLRVGDAKIRLIQWPDVDNIVLDELKTGPWCQFYDGPITNFVHQVITRDAYKNMKLPMLDICPEEYHYALQDDLYCVASN